MDKRVNSDVIEGVSCTEVSVRPTMSTPQVILQGTEINETSDSYKTFVNNKSLTSKGRDDEVTAAAAANVKSSNIGQLQSATHDMYAASAGHVTNNDMPASRELWLKKTDENTSSRTVNHHRPQYSIDERVSRDVQDTLAYQPKNIDQHQRITFDLEAERKKMEQWALEQEQKRQVI